MLYHMKTNSSLKQRIGAVALVVFALLPVRAADLKATPEQIQESITKVKVPDGFKYEVLLQGEIPEPVDLDFCPDGRLWFTGRRGHLWAYDFKTKTKTEIAMLPVHWQPIPGRESNERGLHGLEFDPDFLKNGYIYLHYAPVYPDIHVNSNRIARFTVDLKKDGNSLVPGSEKVLLEYISGRGFHQAGAMEYNARDGKLYISTGDNNVSGETRKFWDNPKNPPQDLGDLRGKTLRLNMDGSVPGDNPFVKTAGARPEIYTYGHRNPYSMNIDPQTGRVFVGEVGYDRKEDWEEINALQAGGNYGWPRLMGTNISTFPTNAPNPYPDAIKPWFTYIHENGANVTSGPLYRAGKGAGVFPAEWRDGMFYADFTRKWLRFAQVDAKSNTVTNTVPFGRGFTGGILSMKQGPDGGLYFVEYSGWFTGTPRDKVARIVYTGTGAAGQAQK